jgi:hypothetical protein
MNFGNETALFSSMYDFGSNLDHDSDYWFMELAFIWFVLLLLFYFIKWTLLLIHLMCLRFSMVQASEEVSMTPIVIKSGPRVINDRSVSLWVVHKKYASLSTLLLSAFAVWARRLILSVA